MGLEMPRQSQLNRPIQVVGHVAPQGLPNMWPVAARRDCAAKPALHDRDERLAGMISNDKFCCTRWGVLQLSWWRREEKYPYVQGGRLRSTPTLLMALPSAAVALNRSLRSPPAEHPYDTQEEPMNTPWPIRRRMIPRLDGARRWDAAYQCLLPWAMDHDPGTSPVPSHPQEESHGRRHW
jgi:hypothetical protein